MVCRKYFLFGILGILFLWLGTSCKEKEWNLTELEIQAIQKVEEENQRIHEFLIQSNSGMPDMQGISLAVQKLLDASGNPPHPLAKELQSKIQSITRKNPEEDFQNYSDFSLQLFPLIRKAQIPNVYKFYCPMTKKYWIARGKKVQNPYSPDMRTCGDLILE